MRNEFLKEYYRGNWDKALEWAKGLSEDKKVTIQDYYLKMIERMEEGFLQIGTVFIEPQASN
jgi:hypothetical protein